jgi:ferredoxin
MTPFGIRNRIKSALGLGGKSEADETYTVTMTLPDGSTHEVRAEHRYTLVMASQSLATPINTACPDGGCGGCPVDVLDGSGLAEPTQHEAKLIAEKCRANQRLACHARVIGNGTKIRVNSVWSMDVTRGER